MPDNLLNFLFLPPWSRILGGFFALYVLFVALVYLYQRKLQYFPDSSIVSTPIGDEFRGIQTVELAAPDGTRCESWYWPGALPSTLVVFHGNAGHRGHRLEWIAEFHRLGYGVFILDYRGYGGSEGSPTERGLYADAETAVRWLREKSKVSLSYLGESLGCGVAVETACRIPPSTLILQSGFDSAVEVAWNAYPYFPARWLLKDRYDSAAKIRTIHCPLLVIHGERDSIIPMRFGRKLFDLADAPKEWLSIAGADHNDLPWVGGKNYWKAMDTFQRRHLRLDGLPPTDG